MDIEGTYFNIVKTIYNKPTAKLFSMVKNWKHFFLRSGTRQGCLLSLLLFNIVLEVLAMAIREEKEIKGTQMERSKTLFVDDVILYIENPQELSENH